jgi:hypothetical protein
MSEIQPKLCPTALQLALYVHLLEPTRPLVGTVEYAVEMKSTEKRYSTTVGLRGWRKGSDVP